MRSTRLNHRPPRSHENDIPPPHPAFSSAWAAPSRRTRKVPKTTILKRYQDSFIFQYSQAAYAPYKLGLGKD